MKGKPQAITQAIKDEIGTRERVYRIFRTGTLGKGIYSALAGMFAPCKDYPRYDYAVDKATLGDKVHIYLDKDFAIEEATAMAKRAVGRQLVVYSAKPIGAIVIPAGKSKTATCDGVVPIEIVKTIPMVKAETWKDITSTLKLDGNFLSDGNWSFYSVYPGQTVKVCTGLPSTFKVATTGTIKVEKLVS